MFQLQLNSSQLRPVYKRSSGDLNKFTGSYYKVQSMVTEWKTFLIRNKEKDMRLINAQKLQILSTNSNNNFKTVVEVYLNTIKPCSIMDDA